MIETALWRDITPDVSLVRPRIREGCNARLTKEVSAEKPLVRCRDGCFAEGVSYPSISLLTGRTIPLAEIAACRSALSCLVRSRKKLRNRCAGYALWQACHEGKIFTRRAEMRGLRLVLLFAFTPADGRRGEPLYHPAVLLQLGE